MKFCAAGSVGSNFEKDSHKGLSSALNVVSKLPFPRSVMGALLARGWADWERLTHGEERRGGGGGLLLGNATQVHLP